MSCLTNILPSTALNPIKQMVWLLSLSFNMKHEYYYVWCGMIYLVIFIFLHNNTKKDQNWKIFVDLITSKGVLIKVKPKNK